MPVICVREEFAGQREVSFALLGRGCSWYADQKAICR